MKVTLSKMSAEGESLMIEETVPSDILKYARQDEGRSLAAYLTPVFNLADLRLKEMNRRILEAKGVMASFDADTRMKVMQIIDILYGGVPSQTIEKIVKEAQQENVPTDREEVPHGRGEIDLD